MSASTHQVEQSPDSRPFGRSGIASAVCSGCYWSLLALAACAPLPFGSARPWAWGLLAVAIGLLVILLVLSDLAGSEEPMPALSPVALPALLFGLAIAWAVIQCLPGMPATWTHPLWQQAAAALPDQALEPRIGIDPAASRGAILRLLSYAGAFWLAFRCCRRDGRARALLSCLAAIAMLYAAGGLVIYLTGNATVLWFEKWAYRDDLTSTFVNRNSYGTFAGLGLVTAIGLLLDEVLSRIDFRERTRTVLRLAVELLATKLLWLVGAVVLGASALVLTHSRGGVAASVVGILALLGSIRLAPSLRGEERPSWGAVLAMMAAAAAILALSGTATLTRIADTSWDLDGRNEIFRLTVQALRDRPLLGTGLGTFKTVFAAYRTEAQPFLIEFAHNAYLENMLELGVPAALALVVAPLLLSATCLRGVVRRRRDAIIPCIGVGATVLIGLHSLVDFSMEIPAVAVWYMLLLGAATASSQPTRERGNARTAT